MARDWDEDRRVHDHRDRQHRDEDRGGRAPRAAMDPGYHDDFGDRDFGVHNTGTRTFGGDLGHPDAREGSHGDRSRPDDGRTRGAMGRYPGEGPRRGRESMGPGYLDRGYDESRGRERDAGHDRHRRDDRDRDDRGRWGAAADRDRRGDERSFWDRASDEVSSWFGDDDAERRRERDMHRGRGPKNYTRSDARILEDVSDRLSEDPYVDASDMEVRVEGGEVTLDGTVDSRSAKRRAEDVAESVSGVTHCQNNLRVRRTGRAELGNAAPSTGPETGAAPRAPGMSAGGGVTGAASTAGTGSSGSLLGSGTPPTGAPSGQPADRPRH